MPESGQWCRRHRACAKCIDSSIQPWRSLGWTSDQLRGLGLANAQEASTQTQAESIVALGSFHRRWIASRAVRQAWVGIGYSGALGGRLGVGFSGVRLPSGWTIAARTTGSSRCVSGSWRNSSA